MLSLLLATAGLRVGVVRMGLFDGAKEAFSTNADKPLVAADRVTPFDRWLGLDKELVEAEAPEQVSFIDPTDAANYVSLQLAKPMGIAFIENEGDTGGICIDEILAEVRVSSTQVATSAAVYSHSTQNCYASTMYTSSLGMVLVGW